MFSDCGQSAYHTLATRSCQLVIVNEILLLSIEKQKRSSDSAYCSTGIRTGSVPAMVNVITAELRVAGVSLFIRLL